MKRFTETEKWRDPWFAHLSATAKLLWFYLLDNCNQIGLVHIDFKLVSRDCGLAIKEKHLAELGDRVQTLQKEAATQRLFLPKFIPFQYGELSAACRPHLRVLQLIDHHKLQRVPVGYIYPYQRVEDKTGQVQDPSPPIQSSSLESAENLSCSSANILAHLNARTGRKFRPTPANLGFIENRLAESGVTLQGVLLMIDRQCAKWRGTSMAEFLRPETLFNATKFDAYYAAKDLPTSEEQPKPAAKLLNIPRI